jgi:membrane fusion protein (multidrug efflux system)
MPRRFAIALALSLAGCREPTLPAPDAQEFPVGSPSIGATFTREWVAQIHSIRQVELRAHHRGIVEGLGVDEGQQVSRGQLLFTISAWELEQELSKAEAAVARAVAELKGARVEAANTRLLFDNGVVSETNLELAEANVEALAARVSEAKAEEAHAKVRLSFARVRAPFDGFVNRLPHREGSLVLEDELLTTITDTSEVFAYFRVSEQDYLEHTATSEADRPVNVRLRLANGADYPHAGVIDAVEGEFDKRTGTIAFRARFPNPDRILKHGATGKVIIERREPDAVVIPQSATFEIQENIYTFTVDDDDVVHATRVIPRGRIGTAFVLERGLSPTDRIVLAGTQRLKDGTQIVAIASDVAPDALTPMERP